MLLEVKNLNKTFGSVKGADNINLSVNKSEIIGIIGANGAGKTTFCNIITGYINADSGSISFKGIDISQKNVHEVQSHGIQRSFQIPQVFNELSVSENIIVSITASKNIKYRFMDTFLSKNNLDEAKEILTKFSIVKYSNYKVSALPQGIRKILDIIMAIVGKPSLLVLDEPTSGVSSSEKYFIMDNVIKALKKMNIAVLFIEHDMEVIEKYSDRVLAFYEGKIIFDGDSDKAFKNKEVIRVVVGKRKNAKKHTRDKKS